MFTQGYCLVCFDMIIHNTNAFFLLWFVFFKKAEKSLKAVILIAVGHGRQMRLATISWGGKVMF